MANTTRGDVRIHGNLEFGAAGDQGAAGTIAQSNGPGAGNSWVTVASIFKVVSDDTAGGKPNAVSVGTDGGAFFQETVTALAYNPATFLLSFTDEDGGTTNFDLSALTTDIYVDGASFDAASTILTLTDNDGGTANVTVDLSTLRSVLTDNGDGTYTHNDGNGTTVTFDTSMVTTVLTGMTAAIPTTIRYTDEAGAVVNVQTVSTDLGNAIRAGSDGKLFASATVEVEFAVADWSALSATTANMYDLTIPAASITALGGNPGSAAHITVVEGSAGAIKDEVGVQTERVLADGSVFLQVTGTVTDDRFDGAVKYTSPA